MKMCVSKKSSAANPNTVFASADEILILILITIYQSKRKNDRRLGESIAEIRNVRLPTEPPTEFFDQTWYPQMI